MDNKIMTIQEIQERLAEKIPAKSIELRVGGKSGDDSIIILCYKDARMDANRLDEVVGCFNWQREHYCVNDVNYCRVGIKNPETGEWVWKSDAGSESKTEAEKGEASDAFKRACFQWGIGRELYNMPVIVLPNIYKFKLKWVTMKLAYYKGTRIPAVLYLYYGKEKIFSYEHEDLRGDDKKIKQEHTLVPV